jgi:hypothetical protein
MVEKPGPLAVRQEHRLMSFENRVLRRTFEPKRDEMTGGWENCILWSFIAHFP